MKKITKMKQVKKLKFLQIWLKMLKYIVMN